VGATPSAREKPGTPFGLAADRFAGFSPGPGFIAPSARHICSHAIAKEISAPSGRHHPPVFKNMSLLNGAGKFIDLGCYKQASPTGFSFCIPRGVPPHAFSGQGQGRFFIFLRFPCPDFL
jgi:hypothetical protein